MDVPECFGAKEKPISITHFEIGFKDWENHGKSSAKGKGDHITIWHQYAKSNLEISNS